MIPFVVLFETHETVPKTRTNLFPLDVRSNERAERNAQRVSNNDTIVIMLWTNRTFFLATGRMEHKQQ
jgi:hypothetical protein